MAGSVAGLIHGRLMVIRVYGRSIAGANCQGEAALGRGFGGHRFCVILMLVQLGFEQALFKSIRLLYSALQRGALC